MASSGQQVGALYVTVTADAAKFFRTMATVKATAANTTIAIAGLGAGIGLAFGAAAYAIKKTGDLIRATGESASEWQTKMMLISKTTGVEGKGLQRISDDLMRLAGTLNGINIYKLAEIAEEAGKVGVKEKDIMAFTKAIALASIAFKDIDPADVAAQLIKISTAFGLAIKDVGRLGSAIAALDIESVATGKELFTMLRGMSGPAAQIGFTFSQTAAWAASMIDAGAGADVASTAFAHYAQVVETGGAEIAKIIGMDADLFARLLKVSPNKAFELFLQSIKDYDVPSEFAIFKKLKLQGRRTGGTLQQTTRTGEQRERYEKIVDKELETGATALRAEALAAGTLNAQWERMLNLVEIVSIKIGNFLLPIETAFASVFGNIMEDIAGFLDWIAPSINAVSAEIAALATALGVMIENPLLVLDVFLAAFVKAFHEIVNFAAICAANVYTYFEFWFLTAANFLKNAFEPVFQWIMKIAQQIGEKFNYIIQQILHPMENIPKPKDMDWSWGGWGDLNRNSPTMDPLADFTGLTNPEDQEELDRAIKALTDAGVEQEEARRQAREKILKERAERDAANLPKAGEKKFDASKADKANKDRGFIGDFAAYQKHIQMAAFGNVHEDKMEKGQEQIAKNTAKTAGEIAALANAILFASL